MCSLIGCCKSASFPPDHVIYKKSRDGVSAVDSSAHGSGMICKVELEYICKPLHYNNSFSLVNQIFQYILPAVPKVSYLTQYKCPV